MSAEIPTVSIPLPVLDRDEDAKETAPRIRAFLSSGGEAKAIRKYLGDLKNPEEPMKAIRLFEYYIVLLSQLSAGKETDKIREYLQLDIEGLNPDYLFCAIKTDRVALLDYFLTNGFDPNGYVGKNIPLHIASEQGEERVVKWLLEHKADPNKENHQGATPLHLTSKVGIAQLLLAKGAKVDARTLQNYTPLHIAANENRGEMIEFLVAKGAEIRAKKMPEGITPFHLADYKGHELAKAKLRVMEAKVYQTSVVQQPPDSEAIAS